MTDARCEPPADLRGGDGWHWLEVGGAQFCHRWRRARGEWGWATIDQRSLAGMRYLSPVATPTEVAALRAENDTLRALLARSDQPCPYCALPSAEIAKCPSGFPGCGRMDDLIVGDAEKTRVELFNSRVDVDALRAEVARLRATLDSIANHPESEHELIDYGPDRKQRIWPTIKAEALAVLAQKEDGE